MPSEDEMRRLAFIRYLYLLAVEQSRSPEPLAAASVLTFHDAVELFLQLAAEHLNVSEKRIEFEKYWALIEPYLHGQRLTEPESMRRLNKLRVTLKHDGTFPSALSIEGFRGSVTSFFEANVPTVFGIEFCDVSMVNLVALGPARANLAEAEMLMSAENLGGALDKIAVAFAQLIDDYEARYTQQLGWSPFDFSEVPAPSMPGLPYYPPPVDLHAYEQMEEMRSSLRKIQTAIEVLSLGLDYRRYARFLSLKPVAHKSETGDSDYIVKSVPADSPLLTAENCRFCYDFVIDSALRMQQSDLSAP